MTKKILLLLLTILLLLLAACTSPTADETITEEGTVVIDVYRAPTWGCCGDWIGYLEDNGFTVKVHDEQDLTAVKSQYNVPTTLQSCHTAIVDGYVIEGHVPVAEINRLLAERPNVVGLAVPGMPAGSPGMNVEGVEAQPYDVYTFDRQGNAETFASYNQ